MNFTLNFAQICRLFYRVLCNVFSIKTCNINGYIIPF